MSTRLTLPWFKRGVQKLLSRAGLYERAKTSWIYDFYWSFADKGIVADRESEVKFYRELLEGFRVGNLIFDIGANQGYKADIFLRLGARVIAVEPDEASQDVLKKKFLKYRFKKKKVVIVPKAVSDKRSTETLWIETPGSAKNTLSKKWAETLEGNEKRFGQKLSFGQVKEVETLSIEDLVAQFGAPLFVKIDVEGHELSVLRGMRRAVPYLSFEVNLPEFHSEGQECIEVLGRLAPYGTFNFAADCRQGLALNKWLPKEEFLVVFNSCTAESIEVFWKVSSRLI
jgi:FkbM family methyltransferase